MRQVKLAGLALIVGLTATVGLSVDGASAKRLPKIKGKPGHDCPYGAVCVYPRGFSFKPGPEKKNGIFYSYGAHNLHHQYGYHLVYNNQYNVNGVAAGVTLCMGYNGKGSEFGGPIMNDRGWWAPVNLTRVNSITLWLYNLRYYRYVNCGG